MINSSTILNDSSNQIAYGNYGMNNLCFSLLLNDVLILGFFLNFTYFISFVFSHFYKHSNFLHV